MKFKPHEVLEGFIEYAWSWAAGGHTAHKKGKIGELTEGEKFQELKSEDIADRRSIITHDINLLGKPRRGRYSQAIGKK